MLGMSGYELMGEIRKIYPLQKIILITGNVNDEHVQHTERNLCYTLPKPFHPEIIFDLLTSLHDCETAHKSNHSLKYIQDCEFSIKHSCPFNQIPSNL